MKIRADFRPLKTFRNSRGEIFQCSVCLLPLGGDQAPESSKSRSQLRATAAVDATRGNSSTAEKHQENKREGGITPRRTERGQGRRS